jgi:hypothetical protein
MLELSIAARSMGEDVEQLDGESSGDDEIPHGKPCGGTRGAGVRRWMWYSPALAFRLV